MFTADHCLSRSACLAYDYLNVLMLLRQGNEIGKVASKSNSWAVKGNHLIIKSAAARLKPSKSDRKRRESDRTYALYLSSYLLYIWLGLRMPIYIYIYKLLDYGMFVCVQYTKVGGDDILS